MHSFCQAFMLKYVRHLALINEHSKTIGFERISQIN